MLDETWHLDVVIIRCFTFQNKKRPPNRLTMRTRMKQRKQRKAQHRNFKTRNCQFEFTELIKLLCKPSSFDLNDRTLFILVYSRHAQHNYGLRVPAEAQNFILSACLLEKIPSEWVITSILALGYTQIVFGPLEIWVLQPWCREWMLGRNEYNQNDHDAIKVGIHEPYYRGSVLM